MLNIQCLNFGHLPGRAKFRGFCRTRMAGLSLVITVSCNGCHRDTCGIAVALLLGVDVVERGVVV
jgi:hypothetical protein